VADVSQPDRSAGDLDRVVVVGASLAGLRACETLRRGGFAGTITLIGAEEHLPYDRPPLSKKLLAGEWEPERIALRKPGDLDALGLDVRLGTCAAGLDLAAGAVTLDDGTDVPYDGLIVATGARPRRLPGQTEGVHELRTLDDSLALRAAFAGGSARVVVVGAGFIGLEVAATARAAGCAVTVLEGAPAPMIRGLGEQMGTAAAAHHSAAGTVVRCGITVTAVHADRVELSVGETVAADVVVVGVGVTPATEWLGDSGLELRDGLVCDETLRAADRVYAAGDVVRWPNRHFDEEMRVEHWTNAAEQGAAAAENLLSEAAGGTATRYAPVPFFWSDQGRQRLQFLGRAGAEDDVEVVVGSTEDLAFVALYGRAGRLRGALGVNLPRLVMPYRALLADKVSWDDALTFAASQRVAQQS